MSATPASNDFRGMCFKQYFQSFTISSFLLKAGATSTRTMRSIYFAFSMYTIQLSITASLISVYLETINNKIRTAGHKSPLQLFILGMQQIVGEGGTFALEYFQILDEVSSTGKSFFKNMTTIKSGSHSKSILREEIHCMAKNYFHFLLALARRITEIKS